MREGLGRRGKTGRVAFKSDLGRVPDPVADRQGVGEGAGRFQVVMLSSGKGCRLMLVWLG